jgi:hypothetical protein
MPDDRVCHKMNACIQQQSHTHCKLCSLLARCSIVAPLVRLCLPCSNDGCLQLLQLRQLHTSGNMLRDIARYGTTNASWCGAARRSVGQAAGCDEQRSLLQHRLLGRGAKHCYITARAHTCTCAHARCSAPDLSAWQQRCPMRCAHFD